jgi:hypothetical protein
MQGAKNHMFKTLLLALLFTVCGYADGEFGYISHSGTNIGDDFQAISAKRFLPKNTIPIDREFMVQFYYSRPVPTIVNGWFMYAKSFWVMEHLTPPSKSWPPSLLIDPLLISMHITKEIHPVVFSVEGIDYLKKHGPVGARDYFTLSELQKRGIPSYFSGCITLTLDNPYKKRKEIIYAVDVDQEVIDYIKKHTHAQVVSVTHAVPGSLLRKHSARLEYAEGILKKYQQAKCVVTSRLHCTMPCLAFGTPVLFLGGTCGRFDGLQQLSHHCTKSQLLNGEIDFDFDHPPANPDDYLPIRENLIRIVTEWVAEKQGRQ